MKLLKGIFLALCFALIMLPAMAAEQQASGQDSEFTPLYNQGLIALKQQRYQDAIRHLQAALAVSPGHRDALKFLTTAAYKAKNQTVTIEAGEAYLKLVPDSSIRMVLANTYLQTGNRDKAIAHFDVVAQREGDEFQQQAQDALAKLQQEQAAKPTETDNYYQRPDGWSGLVIVALENDDNVATTVDEGAAAPSELRDSRLATTLQADYDWRIQDRYYAGTGLMAINNFYNDPGKPFELAAYRLNFHGGMVGNGWDLKLNYIRSYIEFGHEKVITSDILGGQFVHIVSPRYVYVVIGEVEDRVYAQNNLQDAVKYSFQWRNRIYVPELKDGAYVKLIYRYGLNDTDDTSTFSYEYNKGLIGFHYPLPWDMFFKYESEYESRHYDEPDPTKRDDWIHDSTVTVGKDWTRDLSNEIYYTRTTTSSTVDTFDSKQEIWGINLIYSF